MAPTKKELEKGIEQLANFFENSIGRPFKWGARAQNFGKNIKRSKSFLSQEMKLLIAERNRSRQIQLLGRELLEVEGRIREMKEKEGIAARS